MVGLRCRKALDIRVGRLYIPEEIFPSARERSPTEGMEEHWLEVVSL